MKKDIFLLLCINYISAVSYSLVAPLFPIMGNAHKLSEFEVGLLISAYPFVNFISTFFIPSLITKFSRRGLIFYATLIEATCTFSYGLFNSINNYYLLIMIGLIARGLQGYSAGVIATIGYSLVNSISEKNEAAIFLGYMEVVWTIGVSSGPLFASFLYFLGGYSLTFLFCGSLSYSSSYFVKLLKIVDANDITEDLTKEQLLDNINVECGSKDNSRKSTCDSENEKDIKNNNTENFEITQNTEINNTNIFKYFLHLEIIIAIIAVIADLLGDTFFMPSLTNHLMKNYGLTVSQSSLFFAISLLGSAFCLLFLNKFIEILGFYRTTALGLICISISELLIYPVNPIPMSLIIVIAGLFLKGCFSTLVNIPAILILSEILGKNYSELNNFEVSDLASALYNLGLNGGDFLGPLIGGFISNSYGFLKSCIFTSLMTFIFFIIYLVYYKTRIVINCKDLLMLNTNKNSNLLNNKECSIRKV